MADTDSKATQTTMEYNVPHAPEKSPADSKVVKFGDIVGGKSGPEKPEAAKSDIPKKVEPEASKAPKPPKEAKPDKAAGKAPDAEKKPPARKGRPPKADKPDKAAKPPKAEKQVLSAKNPTKGKAAKTKASPAPEPEKPPEPIKAPRSGEKEEIVHISLGELHAFKGHPFLVRDNKEMQAMIESVKDKGVTQPAVVRPREGGGYEIVSGHRRQMASSLAGYTDMPCIVRNMTDEQAITQMVEDNTNQRESLMSSERAKALKMQLEAIKRQGSRSTEGPDDKENGKRTNQIVADRNKMTVKQVQRYIKLNDLVPDLMKMVDNKELKFTPAVELAFIGKKNQRYIAVAIEGQQAPPSLSQAQRMRQLDNDKLLNPDVIDGIMTEEKKEVDKVIISTQELNQYFGKEKTPREMKDQIIALLEDWKSQQKDIAKPEKKTEAR